MQKEHVLGFFVGMVVKDLLEPLIKGIGELIHKWFVKRASDKTPVLEHLEKAAESIEAAKRGIGG